MKITTDFILTLKTKEVEEKVTKAAHLGLKDIVVDITNDAKKLAKKVTGNNARSINWEIGPGGEIAKTKLEGAIYSTSGYGGYLETGTRFMAAQPYLKPALDKNMKNIPKNIKANLK